MTSASSTRQLRVFRVTSRSAGPICPSERMPVDDLVQQRLEEVVVVPVDQGDVDGRHRQRLGGEEAAEAAADDDDSMASVQAAPSAPSSSRLRWSSSQSITSAGADERARR